MEVARPAPSAKGLLKDRPLVHLFLFAIERKLTGSLIFSEGTEETAYLYLFEGLPTRLSRVGAPLRLLESALPRLFDLPETTSFAFYNGFDAVGDLPGEPTDPYPFLLDGLERNPPRAHLDPTIRKLLRVSLRLETDFARFQFAEPERTALKAFDAGAVRVAEFVETCGLTRTRAEALLYLLVVTKVVVVDGVVGKSIAPSPLAAGPLAAGPVAAAPVAVGSAPPIPPAAASSVPKVPAASSPLGAASPPVPAASASKVPIAAPPRPIASPTTAPKIPTAAALGAPAQPPGAAPPASQPASKPASIPRAPVAPPASRPVAAPPAPLPRSAAPPIPRPATASVGAVPVAPVVPAAAPRKFEAHDATVPSLDVSLRAPAGPAITATPLEAAQENEDAPIIGVGRSASPVPVQVKSSSPVFVIDEDMEREAEEALAQGDEGLEAIEHEHAEHEHEHADHAANDAAFEDSPLSGDPFGRAPPAMRPQMGSNAGYEAGPLDDLGPLDARISEAPISLEPASLEPLSLEPMSLDAQSIELEDATDELIEEEPIEVMPASVRGDAVPPRMPSAPSFPREAPSASRVRPPTPAVQISVPAAQVPPPRTHTNTLPVDFRPQGSAGSLPPARSRMPSVPGVFEGARPPTPANSIAPARARMPSTSDGSLRPPTPMGSMPPMRGQSPSGSDEDRPLIGREALKHGTPGIPFARVRLQSQVKAKPLEEQAVVSPGDRRRSNPAQAAVEDPQQEARRQEILERAETIDDVDYFTLLGVARDATADQVNSAFFALAKRWHPDRLPPALDSLKLECSKVFAKMSEAHQTLTDRERRARYLEDVVQGAARAKEQEKVTQVLDAAQNFQKAEILFKRGDMPQAELLAKRALEGDPGQADYLALVSWIAALKPENQSPERLQPLVRDLSAAIKRNEKCERAYVARGNIYKKLGQIEAAVRDFKEVVELNPRNVDAQREVRLYNMRGDAKGGKGKSAGGAGMFGKLFKK